jgi:1-acyl-sn-glycerol-3-phosphate acyltransferase
MPDTDHPARRCNVFAHLLGVAVMKLFGWKVEGRVPDSKKMIVIAAPHTTNWDFIFLLGAAYSLRLGINWLGKDTLFPPVLGSFLKFLGGVPVDRSRNTNLVQTLAKSIKQADDFTLIIPPAGTRRKTDYWKSGFYRVALATKIPLVCGYLDYEKKVACLGLSFIPTGDMAADMDRIREFYKPITGKYPENTSIIRLKEEDASST